MKLKILTLLAGAALVAAGAWLIYEPAGVIVAGVELVVLALFAGEPE